MGLLANRPSIYVENPSRAWMPPVEQMPPLLQNDFLLYGFISFPLQECLLSKNVDTCKCKHLWHVLYYGELHILQQFFLHKSAPPLIGCEIYHAALSKTWSALSILSVDVDATVVSHPSSNHGSMLRASIRMHLLFCILLLVTWMLCSFPYMNYPFHVGGTISIILELPYIPCRGSFLSIWGFLYNYVNALTLSTCNLSLI